MPEEDIGESTGRDITDMVCIGIMIAGLIFNAWIMWDQVKDRPEMMVMRNRVKSWWERKVTSPSRKAKAMRKAEGETIFEAMRIVEGQ